MIATDFESLLRTLLDHDVEFILVGGVAANLHGSARATIHSLDGDRAPRPKHPHRLTTYR